LAVERNRVGGEKQARRLSVKLENFCYNVAMKALELLEREHHYKIPEQVKKQITETVIKQMDSLMES
jgi:protein-tyrosine-phosphatase